jgi:hypothetical protein
MSFAISPSNSHPKRNQAATSLLYEFCLFDIEIKKKYDTMFLI